MIGAVNIQVTTAQEINARIAKAKKEVAMDTNRISDGYHTFGELYDHRIELYIALARFMALYYEKNDDSREVVWRSKVHSDGTSWDGWFVLGIGIEYGEQITYHLPASKWDLCDFAKELDKAPEFDGHTSEDVLERLKYL